jgi:hypothetical protein
MSAGTGASNLGYSNISPYSKSPHVNGTSSNYSGSFSSNEISKVNMVGGAKKLKRKIKNITKQYKRMKNGSRKLKSIKKRLRSRSRSIARHLAGKRRTRSRRQRGGQYAQYNGGVPNTPAYQVAGIHLPPNLSALANPAPFTRIGGNCADSYNHYQRAGSR